MIALDGADGPLLDRLSNSGALPNLAALRARGSVKHLTAHAGATDDALWASFQYATGMGEHGRYHYLQRLRDGKFGMVCNDEIDQETFWEATPDLKIAVFDIPKCRLPRKLNGIHLADWLVHGRYFHEPKSYPASLAAEIVERFGAAPPSRCGHEAVLEEKDIPGLVSNLRVAVAMKHAAALHFLSSEAWDLFIVGFKEAHCIGHELWGSDGADPESRDWDIGTASPIETILRDIDRAIGELVSASGSEAQIVVFSTTEMQPNGTLAHLMPEIVARVNRALGESLLTRLMRHVTKANDRRSWPLCEILPYNENCAALRINAPSFVRGEAIETARSRLVDEVEYLLMELRDDLTGHAIITEIDRPARQHAGARATALPDLLVHCGPGRSPTSLRSSSLGRIEAHRPNLRPGNHAPGGFLIAVGEMLDLSIVTGMQHLGPMAMDVFQVTPAP
jgi:hypothetical protein